MKAISAVLALVALAIVLTGCGGRHLDAHAHADEPTPACSFKEGLGLELTPAGAAFIGLKTADFTSRLPHEALLRTAKGDFVYVVNGPRLLRTPVKVAADGTGWSVDEGLYEGDQVAVAGVQGLWLAELQATNGGVGCAHGH